MCDEPEDRCLGFHPISAMPDIRVSIYCSAIGSQELYRPRWLLALLGSISKHAQGKSNSSNFGVTFRWPIRHYSGKFWNVGQPTSTLFLLVFDLERFGF